MNKVNAIDVKRSFILANAMKSPFESGENTSSENLVKIFNEEKDKYMKFNEQNLNGLINGLELGKSLEEIGRMEELLENQDRVTRYEKLLWSYGSVGLNKIGAWPEMRGIDPRLTTSNILNTALEIYNYSHKSTKYNFSDKRKANIEALVRLIESMKSNPLIERLPLILVPGNSIRGENYKKWVMENHKDYHEHNISLLGVDEGNVRAVTLALMGKDKVLSYVGSCTN